MHLQCVPEFQVKHLEKAEVGELVCFPFGGGEALGIVCKKPESDRMVFAILRAPADFEHVPFHLATDVEGYCMSYGIDWELQLFPDARSFNGDGVDVDAPGTIFVTEKGASINLAGPASSKRDTLYFEFKSGTFSGGPSRQAVPVLRWKIWQRRGQSTMKGDRPIIAFPAS
jgi:hypothetical protein